MPRSPASTVARVDARPVLPGERVRLRAFRPADFDALFALHADPAVMRYWSFPAWTDPAQARDYFARGSAWHGLLAREWRARRPGLSPPAP